MLLLVRICGSGDGSGREVSPYTRKERESPGMKHRII